MTKIKVQAGLIAIALFNIFINLTPGSRLRRFFLALIGIKVGTGTGIHSWIRFTWIGRLIIGSDSTINFGCFIDNRGGIKIGNHVMVGHNCRLYTMSHDLDSGDFAPWKKPIEICDWAVVFPNTIIMPGVTIGTGAVALPGSVVTRDIAPWSVVGGNPARHIRTRAMHQNYRIDYQYLFINS
jgi:acetyltransferase-like isoleucine patch superfamily enzyme